MTWFLDKSPTQYERLTEERKRLESEANQVGPGSARNKLLEKLRQLDAAAHIKRVAVLSRSAAAGIGLAFLLGDAETVTPLRGASKCCCIDPDGRVLP